MSYPNAVLSAAPECHTLDIHTDRRYWPRWEAAKRVVCRLQDTDYALECQSQDLSCAGISLRADQDISPRDHLSLTIFLEEDTSFQIEGRLVWHQVADHYHKHGIIFDRVSPEIQELICEHAFTITPLDLLSRIASVPPPVDF
jgi:hypothetical protein